MWNLLLRAIASAVNWMWTTAGGEQIAIVAFQTKAIQLAGI